MIKSKNTCHLLAAFAVVSVLSAHSFVKVSDAAAQETPADIAQLERRVSAGDAEAMKKLGEILLKTGDTAAQREKGVELLEQAGAAGRQDAIAALGTAYLWGNGVEADPGKAQELLARAADGGHAASKRILGEQFITGWVLPVNRERGLEMLEAGVKAGDVKSKGILGRLLLEGKYLPSDSARGLSLLNEAIDAKDKDSIAALGLAYRDGKGVQADPVKARDLLLQAAASGNDVARRQLGEALVKGQGVAKDVKAGLGLLDQAVAASDKRAHLVLGQLYLDGTYIKRDMRRATEVLLAMDKLGKTGEGAEIIGSQILKTSRARKDLLLGESYLRRAGEAGRGSAWFTLARAASREKLAGSNPKKYKEYSQKARNAGVEGIAVVEAERHLWGFGTRANSDKAIQILSQAAKSGNKQAVRYLVKLTRDGNGWKVKPDRKLARKYLARYGNALPSEENTRLGIILKASGQRSPEAIEALSAEIAASPAMNSTAFHKELFTANPNLSVYLLQQKLKTQQIYAGNLSGMFNNATLQAIKDACALPGRTIQCQGNPTSPDTIAALLSQ